MTRCFRSHRGIQAPRTDASCAPPTRIRSASRPEPLSARRPSLRRRPSCQARRSDTRAAPVRHSRARPRAMKRRRPRIARRLQSRTAPCERGSARQLVCADVATPRVASCGASRNVDLHVVEVFSFSFGVSAHLLPCPSRLSTKSFRAHRQALAGRPASAESSPTALLRQRRWQRSSATPRSRPPRPRF